METRTQTERKGTEIELMRSRSKLIRVVAVWLRAKARRAKTMISKP